MFTNSGIGTESLFLLEQLAMTLFEEGVLKKKPKLQLLRGDDSSSSGSSSSSSKSGSGSSKSSSKRNKVDKVHVVGYNIRFVVFTIFRIFYRC